MSLLDRRESMRGPLNSPSVILLCQTQVVVIADRQGVIGAMSRSPSDALRVRAPNWRLGLACRVAQSHIVILLVCDEPGEVRHSLLKATFAILKKWMTRGVRPLVLGLSIDGYLQVRAVYFAPVNGLTRTGSAQA